MGGGEQWRTSALLSAFFSRWRRNWQLFLGQRHCVAPVIFAWACRPTQPLKKRKGMACLCATTSSRYFLAFFRLMFLMAAAVTHVFLKCTRRSEPEALHDLVVFSASREYFTMPAASLPAQPPQPVHASGFFALLLLWRFHVASFAAPTRLGL